MLSTSAEARDSSQLVLDESEHARVTINASEEDGNIVQSIENGK